MIPRPSCNPWPPIIGGLCAVASVGLLAFVVWLTMPPAYQPYPTPRPYPTAPVLRMDAPIVPTWVAVDGLPVVIVASATAYALPPTPTPLPLPTATPYQSTLGAPDIGERPGFWGMR